MKNNIIFILSLFLMQSCVEKNKEKQITDNKILSESEYKIVCRNILSSKDILERDFKNHNKIGTVDTVKVKQINFKEKKIFIYTNRRTTDTLLNYVDSIYKYNNQILKFIGSKKMLFNHDSINVLKYRYLQDGKKSMPANLYIDETNGVIVLQAGSQWRWIVEYDNAFRELHKEILMDSVFFDFEQENNNMIL